MTDVMAPAETDRESEPVVRKKRQRWTRFILPVFTIAMIVYLAFPVLVMIVYSFNKLNGERQNPQFTCCTLEHWGNILAVPELNAALRTSLKVAFPAAIIATILGTFVGLVLGRYSFRGRGATNFVIFLAIAVPEIVLGSALLSMFVQLNAHKPLGLSLTPGNVSVFGLQYPVSILLSHIAFSIAFVAITVRARVQGMDLTLENAAQDLFATPRQAFVRVTLPMIFPGILAGFLLAFVLSLDDFVITNFVNGSTNTFPTWVYGATRLGMPPQVNVWGTVLFTVGVLTAGVQLLKTRSAATT
jgi:spermidine/putrescine transport system permease protein